MNKTAVAKELVRIAEKLVGSDKQAGPKVRNLEEGIAQARANAKQFGKTYYINSVLDGMRVESYPITQHWTGNKTLAVVRPDGTIQRQGSATDDVERRYQSLSRKQAAELREIIKQSHRVYDVSGTDKRGLIADILRAEFGDKKVDTWAEENK